MEFMLQAVVVVFMLFLCALCLFAVVVIVRDIIRENANAKRNRDADVEPVQKEPIQVVLQSMVSTSDQTSAPTPVVEVVSPAPVVEEVSPAPVVEEVCPAPVVEEVCPAPVVEEVVEPAVIADVAVTEAPENPDAVVFSKVSLTMTEKYAMLSTEFKRYFDDIIRHALSKEGVSEFKRNSAYDYKLGSYRVLRITIKRGEIVCEFNFIERDFKNYASEASVKVKQLGTVVKVTEASAVGVVKDGIDLVVSQIAADKEYKKQLAREKRREKRRRAKEE